MNWFEIKNGKFNWLVNEKESFKQNLINRKDGVYFVRIFENENEKTHNQLKYFHGVICKVLAQELGYRDHLEIKKFLKLKFVSITNDELILKLTENFKGTEDSKLAYIEHLESLDLPPVTKSLARLSIKEMSEFIEKCIDFAFHEYNISIPKPTVS